MVVYFQAKAGGPFELPPPPSHLFVLDRRIHPSTTVNIGDLALIDVNQSGIPGDGNAVSAAASDDGSVVALVSEAGNLMPGEVNNHGPGHNGSIRVDR